MATSFRLDEGIYLEDRDLLLPWGETPDRLARVGTPKTLSDDFDHVIPQKEGRRLRLVWESCVFLGGLKGLVAAQFWTFSRPKKGLDDQTCLHEVLLGVDGLSNDPKESWKQFLHLMNERIGTPKEARRGRIGAGATWKIAGTEIRAVPGDRVEEMRQFFVRRV